MIYLLLGENLYNRDYELARLTKGGEVERYLGEDIDLNDVNDIFSGTTLFSTKRTIVIDELSANKSTWSILPDRLGSLDDSFTLILLEPRIDKRTSSYKWLSKHAEIIDNPTWKLTDQSKAENWLKSYASKQNCNLNREIIIEMIQRAIYTGDDGKAVIDQGMLANAVNQLKHHPATIDAEALDAVMVKGTHQNIFELLASALNRDTSRVQAMIDDLMYTEDGHRALGLLISQLTNLAALVLADHSRSVDQVAKDISAHPFALKQLVRYASNMSRSELSEIVRSVAEADLRSKQGQADPWTLIRNALLAISSR